MSSSVNLLATRLQAEAVFEAFQPPEEAFTGRRGDTRQHGPKPWLPLGHGQSDPSDFHMLRKDLLTRLRAGPLRAVERNKGLRGRLQACGPTLLAIKMQMPLMHYAALRVALQRPDLIPLRIEVAIRVDGIAQHAGLPVEKVAEVNEHGESSLKEQSDLSLLLREPHHDAARVSNMIYIVIVIGTEKQLFTDRSRVLQLSENVHVKHITPFAVKRQETSVCQEKHFQKQPGCL